MNYHILRKLANDIPHIEENMPFWLKYHWSFRNMFLIVIPIQALDAIGELATGHPFYGLMHIIIGLAVVSLIYVILQFFYKVIYNTIALHGGIDQFDGISLRDLFIDSRDAIQFGKYAKRELLSAKNNDKISRVLGPLVYAVLTSGGIIYSYLKTGDVLMALFGINYVILFPLSYMIKITQIILWSIVATGGISISMSIYNLFKIMRELTKKNRKFFIFAITKEIVDMRIKYQSADLKKDNHLYEFFSERGQISILYHFSKNVVRNYAVVASLTLSFFIVLGMVSALTRILGMINPFRMYTSILVITVGLSFSLFTFIYPQLQFHYLMKDYKKNMSALLRDMLNQNLLEYLYAEKESREVLSVNISFLYDLIHYYDEIRIWPYSSATLLQILSLSTLLIQSNILEFILEVFPG